MKKENSIIQIKKIDKKIKRLNKINAVLDYFLGFTFSGKVPRLLLMCAAVSIGISLFAGFFVPYKLRSNYRLPAIISMFSVFPLLFVMEKIYDIIDNKINRLEVERKELVKNEARKELIKELDNTEAYRQYITPEPTVSINDKFKENNKSKGEDVCIKEKIEEEKQSLIEKARLRRIEVDKIKQGQSAYGTEKEYEEAKAYLKNFIEKDKENEAFVKELLDRFV